MAINLTRDTLAYFCVPSYLQSPVKQGKFKSLYVEAVAA